MSSDSIPTVRLRPNRGKAYLGGHPWVYRDELVMDRRTGKIEPGSIVRLQDAERVDIGVVALNPESEIAARELDRDSDANVDAAWIGARLARAFELRARMFERPFYRLSHGEGDGLPGLVIDRLGDYAVIQPNTAWAEANLAAILDNLKALIAPVGILINRDSRGRTQEGLSGGREVAFGTIPETVQVSGVFATLQADLSEGQKTGVYFDQFPNHAHVAGLAAGKRLLDVFSHSGGFALSALGAGAEAAIAIDSSEYALSLARKAASEAGLEPHFDARRGDAVELMRGLAGEGAQFDIVICDPPAFAPRKSVLEAGLRAYGKVASTAVPLVAPGGLLFLCSCSHAVTPDALRGCVATALNRARRRGRLIYSGGAGPDHPIHPALPAHGYLKVLGFALD